MFHNTTSFGILVGMRRLFLGIALIAWLIGAPRVSSAQDTVIPLQGDVPTDALDHFFVPFEVIDGTVEIEVRHDDLSEANILDWGLQDPHGFRGWGGGNVEPAVVGVDAASRSYIPGPISAGTWSVIVGKAKLPELPAHYDIEVVLRTTPTLPPQPERQPYAPASPLEVGSRWYAGDFHVHCRESGDARPTLGEIATFARTRGLDFVEISDHNVLTQLDFFAAAQATSEVLFVPGMEWTSYHGHANAMGITDWVDHKVGQPGVTIDSAVQKIHDQGALFAINHPSLVVGDRCIGCGWDLEIEANRIDATEITTGGWKQSGFLFGKAAIKFWDDLSATGAHVAPIGGSDDHKAGVDVSGFESPIGSPTTMVFADELSVESILQAVQDGHTVVKLQDPDDPMVELRVGDSMVGDTVHAFEAALSVRVSGGGDTLRFVKNGVPEPEMDITSDPFDTILTVAAPEAGEDRYRAEVYVAGAPRTVTNHIWLTSEGAEPLAGPAEAEGGGCGCSIPRRSNRGSAVGLTVLVILGLRRKRGAIRW